MEYILRNDLEYRLKTKNHYIAYFDILGYKNLVYQDKNFLEKVDHAMNQTKHDFVLIKKFLGLVLTETNINYKVFSDNVILFVECSDSPQINIINLCTLIYCVKNIQLALVNNAGVFVRGAITKGDFFYNSDFIYGKGLVEVTNLEKAAKYPRIVVDEKVVSDLDRFDFSELEKGSFFDNIIKTQRAHYKDKLRDFIYYFNSEPKHCRLFESFVPFGDETICEFLDSIEWATESANENDINRAVAALKEFIRKIKDHGLYLSDNAFCVNYLNLGLKRTDCRWALLKCHQVIKKHLDSFNERIRFLKKHLDKYSPEDYTEILSKYDWVKNYHNQAVESLNIELLIVNDFYE